MAARIAPPRFAPPASLLADASVLLRPPVRADATAIAAACTDPDIARWTTVPSPYTVGHARRFVRATARAWQSGRGEAAFAIVDRDSGLLAGMIGVGQTEPGVAEVGYWVAPEVRGRGIATHALRLLARWAFTDPDLVRLQLRTLVGNDASGAVARKAGFSREGVSRRGLRFRGSLVDGVVFSLLREDLAGREP